MAGRASLPVQLTTKRITEEQVALHHHIPPIGENTPISVDPLPVGDLVPMEDDIKWVVWRLKDERSGGPSGIRFEHLQQWIWEAQKAEQATAAVTGSVTIMEVDMETVNGAET